MTADAMTNFQSIAGKGVQGEIDGNSLSPRLPGFSASNMGWHRCSGYCDTCSRQGKTVVAVARAARRCSAISPSPTRCAPARPRAVARLQAMGIEVVMLTGDNAATAQAIAAQAGITQFPRRSAAAATRRRKWTNSRAQGKIVGMAGDGINDAPALAAADVSFAIGAAPTWRSRRPTSR